MGKYSNIDARNLKNVANNALNELAQYAFSDVKSDIDNSNVLVSDAKKNLLDAINDVIKDKKVNGSILNLAKNLNTLKTVAEYIDMCKAIELDIHDLEIALHNLNGKDSTFIYKQIDDKKRTISSYENKINSLLSK